MGLAVGAFAQGQISFQATAANGLISYSTDNATSALAPIAGVPTYGAVSVGFYTAPNGTALTLGSDGTPNFTGWTFNSLIATIATGAGKTSAKTITVANAANGVSVEMEVVGWTGTATSWAQAVAAGTGLGGWSGKTFTGTANGQLGWVQGTGDPTAAIPGVPVATVTGAGGYSGLVLTSLTPVPEPSTIALGGLGAAALLLFRRRK